VANENQDFYECVALSGVARDNPGPERAIVKEISILFDYEQEHTLIFRRWLEDMDVELIPTELKIVTSSLGSYRGETPIPSDLEADFPEPEAQRLLKITGDPDFCQHRNVLELPESGEPAAEAEDDEDIGRGQEVAELP
jgi:hypothetical protein